MFQPETPAQASLLIAACVLHGPGHLFRVSGRGYVKTKVQRGDLTLTRTVPFRSFSVCLLSIEWMTGHSMQMVLWGVVIAGPGSTIPRRGGLWGIGVLVLSQCRCSSW